MVELRETGNIMVDMARMMITSGANGQKVNGGALINAGQKKPPELKATLYTWRERLPNKWDALKDWDDIFCWRSEVRLLLFYAADCLPFQPYFSLLAVLLSPLATFHGIFLCLNFGGKIPHMQMFSQRTDPMWFWWFSRLVP